MDGIKAGRRLWGGGWLGKEEEGWEDYNAYSGERGGWGEVGAYILLSYS